MVCAAQPFQFYFKVLNVPHFGKNRCVVGPIVFLLFAFPAAVTRNQIVFDRAHRRADRVAFQADISFQWVECDSLSPNPHLATCLIYILDLYSVPFFYTLLFLGGRHPL